MRSQFIWVATRVYGDGSEFPTAFFTVKKEAVKFTDHNPPNDDARWRVERMRASRAPGMYGACLLHERELCE